MKRGFTALMLSALLLAALGGFGCEDQEAPRSRLVITRIASCPTEQNSSDYVIQSDVISQYGTVFEDQVYLTVENQPRSDLLALTPTGPYGAAVLTKCSVRYEVPGEHIDPITAGMHLTIPSGQTTIARIVIVAAISKVEPPLSTLAGEPPIEPIELLGTAYVTLTGYELTSDEPVKVECSIQVHFANWADED